MSLPESSYTISVPESKLSTLRQKLALAELPDELEDAGRKYGAPLADIQRLVARWKDGFDWRKVEAKLNEELDGIQFTRDIEVEGHGTLNVHYVHKKSSVEGAVPLLFVHGWPGSFLEVMKLLPLLTSSEPSENPSFHVVSLSLPGFGFSQSPRQQGFALTPFAEVCNKLMLALGYPEYVTQGGDWGFYITRRIAQVYGNKHSKAWHTNYPGAGASKPTFLAQPLHYLSYMLTPYTADETAGFERSKWFFEQGFGYNSQQSTQPQTLGYALTDSPVGLLAWIYEKLVNWTDDYPWDDDEVLTWVSIYLFSRAGPAASLRIYYEVTQANEKIVPPSQKPTIPMGWSSFPRELRIYPRKWVDNVGNLVFVSSHTKGGHFAAHERPQELVEDLRKMFGKGGPAFGVVKDKNGF